MKSTETIEKVTKEFFKQFEEPVWQTKSKEVAFRIAQELGPDYSMTWNGRFFSFHLRMEKNHLDTFNRFLEDLKSGNTSKVLEPIFFTNQAKVAICSAIEKVVESIEAEKRQEIVDRIELEEETRSKFRRY